MELGIIAIGIIRLEIELSEHCIFYSSNDLTFGQGGCRVPNACAAHMQRASETTALFKYNGK